MAYHRRALLDDVTRAVHQHYTADILTNDMYGNFRSRNADGSRDAIMDGRTGLQVPVRDPKVLKEALARLVRDPSLCDAMGAAGREWVSAHFDQKVVWRRDAEEYRALVSGVKMRTRRGRGRSAG